MPNGTQVGGAFFCLPDGRSAPPDGGAARVAGGNIKVRFINLSRHGREGDATGAEATLPSVLCNNTPLAPAKIRGQRSVRCYRAQLAAFPSEHGKLPSGKFLKFALLRFGPAG